MAKNIPYKRQKIVILAVYRWAFLSWVKGFDPLTLI